MILGGGRKLADLLFITSSDRLAANIGIAAASRVELMIKSANQGFLDLRQHGAMTGDGLAQVRDALKRKDYAGVVLVGGLDVVPAQRLDVLDSAMRRRIEEIARRKAGLGDSDQFIVWNDDHFGDLDGDGLPELPVSRIPDGQSASLVLAQLSCAGADAPLASGIRNLDRPFAEDVFAEVVGSSAGLLVSDPTTASGLGKQSLRASLYFMLHGRDTDSKRYWGEDEFGDTVEAVDISNVPASLTGGVVLLGCCWGALTATPRASKYQAGDTLVPKTADDSLALAFLSRGATAVVGCTGTHYSPSEQPPTYFGQPMHASFWRGIQNNEPPARAIFDAKREYAMNLPHGQNDVVSTAIELKICRQFCCLGLGW